MAKIAYFAQLDELSKHELSCKSYERNKRGGGRVDTQCIIIYTCSYCNLSNLAQGSPVTLSLFKCLTYRTHLL